MREISFKRTISQIYLSSVPVVTAILGFTVKDVSYKIYLPLWIINICLMLLAAWFLAACNIKTSDDEKKHLIVSGCLLIMPWMLFSIFAGMGAPPETFEKWIASGFEQQIRYSLLIIGGILMTLGFTILRENLKNSRGNIYSSAGFTAIIIAMVCLY